MDPLSTDNFINIIIICVIGYSNILHTNWSHSAFCFWTFNLQDTLGLRHAEMFLGLTFGLNRSI